ncbi:hypothetical protein EDB86DRAFT_3074499 [Lactarius hatsudake]|nr:hypothetical protein EDB86DRAFT_3074499 [Lactarius hatsudake]
MDASACAATEYHQYAPRGQFRPWAVLALPSFTTMYRLAYPTLICTNSRHAFLYDVRTGSLVQTIDIHLQICYVDVNERYVFIPGVVVAVGCVGGMSAAHVAVIVIVTPPAGRRPGFKAPAAGLAEDDFGIVDNDDNGD